MNVLDPFEVAYIRMWPLSLAGYSKKEVQQKLNQAEYTAYKTLLKTSKLKAVLNEKPPRKTGENRTSIPRARRLYCTS